MKLKIRDLATAGQPDEGKVTYYIEDGSINDGVNDETGPWTRVDITFRVLNHETEGDFEHKPFVFDSFFVNSPKGLERFLNLYSGTLGYLPEEGDIDPETGEPSVDLEDLIQDLKGREVCGVLLYDTRNTRNGRYGLRTGWSFGPTYKDVRMPRKRTTDN